MVFMVIVVIMMITAPMEIIIPAAIIHSDSNSMIPSICSYIPVIYPMNVVTAKQMVTEMIRSVTVCSLVMAMAAMVNTTPIIT